MRKRSIGFLLTGLLLSALSLPALAAGDRVSGFYGIGSAENVTVEAVAFSASVSEEALMVGGKRVLLQKGSDQLKVTVNDAAAGEYLVMLTDDQTGQMPAESSQVLYIDQCRADDSGRVSFTVYPDLSAIREPTDLTLLITNNAGQDPVRIPLSYLPAEEYLVMGDVTGDRDVSMADVVKLSRSVAGFVTLTEEEKKLGDVTGDNDISMAGVVKVSRFVAGFVTDLTPPQTES